MKIQSKCIATLFAFGLYGCAGVPPPTGQKPAEKAAAPGKPHRLIIYIPQTDQYAPAWLKLFEKYPSLRMVIALSPRFNRFAKEPLLKEKVLELQASGRLELAVQIPNAPFLPLIIHTDSAKSALPPETPLPTPPFAQPDDATQILAKAKADFTRAWGAPPKGLVLPLGAVNQDVLKVAHHLRFDWVVGALRGPSPEGVYRFKGLYVWDATPAVKNDSVLVWDERVYGNPDQSLKMLNTWTQETLTKKEIALVLPSEPGLPDVDLPESGWGNRTWTTPDWSPWIGSPAKNAAWSWLRTTREALEKYKNSGQASVRRLDMAFEEIFNAENANYFSGIKEGEATFTMAEEREREFKATLSSVYRLIGQAPPDNLFDAEVVAVPGFKGSATTVTWNATPDGGRLVIEDPEADAQGDGQLKEPPGANNTPGQYDLRRLEVQATADTLEWTLTLGSIPNGKLGNFETPGALVDLYLDLNNQANVGTIALLPGRSARMRPPDAWEYAFSLWGSQARFYRTRGTETYDLAETVPFTVEGNKIRFSTPRTWMRGNPSRWGYQAVVMVYDPKSLENDVRPLVLPEMEVGRRFPLYDIIDPLDVPQAPLLRSLEDGSRNGLPLVRVPK